MQTRQTFRPKGASSRPRLHEIALLRHSSCKRGKCSSRKGCSRQAFRPKGAFRWPRLHENGHLRHSSCKRGKHSDRRGRFSGRDCMKTATCATPAANAASIPAKRGIFPAAIARNWPSAALQLQTRQAFRPKGSFLRPRLHKIGHLRHSSCKRGKLSHRSIQREQSRRGVLLAAIAQNRPSAALQLQTQQAFRPNGASSRSRLHEIGHLRHSSCKRGKHSGQKGRSPAAIAQNQRSAALQLQTRQALRPKGAILRPRLHENALLQHSSRKRGKHSGQKGHLPGRDCTKSAFCATLAANVASCHIGAYSVSSCDGVFSQPRLHKIGLLRHSSSKRGKKRTGQFKLPRSVTRCPTSRWKLFSVYTPNDESFVSRRCEFNRCFS